MSLEKLLAEEEKLKSQENPWEGDLGKLLYSDEEAQYLPKYL